LQLQRWTFTMPTPLGDTRSSYEVTDEGLRYESDAPFGGGQQMLRWDSMTEGGTAALPGMGGRGAPDLPRWIPREMEWLLIKRSSSEERSFMGVLPQGPARDAIVTAVRERLGPRWLGERMPLPAAQSRLAPNTSWSGFKVAGIVIAVLALLVLLLLVLGLLASPLFLIPAGFAFGGWLFHSGLTGLRDGITVANTPTAKTSSAALGLVELEGRAVTTEPSPAGITGRPSVWWDVSVELWYEDGKRGGKWRQVAARHGGTLGVVEIADDFGRLPIWLKDADLLLETDTWEAGKNTLPEPGRTLLDGLGFPWDAGRKIRVHEQRLEANGTLYVLGTLDEAGRLPDEVPVNGLARTVRLVRNGEWRRALIGMLPTAMRTVVAVLIAFLDMLTSLGRGGERTRRAEVATPPALPATAPVVWKGRSGRPFLVSDRPERAALGALRTRSLWRAGIGIGVLCFTLYQLIDIL
jgi:hypothetical protein